MNSRILGFLTAVLMAGPMAANAQYVYTYTGANYDSFSSYPADQEGNNPYTTGDQLTIQLTTSHLLPANLQPSNGYDFQGVGLVSLTVSDGIRSETYTASQIFGGSGQVPFPSIEGGISTNSTGGIVEADIEGVSMVGSKNLFEWSSTYSNPGCYRCGNSGDNVQIGPTDSEGTTFFAASSGVGRWTYAPEIDAASAAGGLTLLLTGLAIGAWYAPKARRYHRGATEPKRGALTIRRASHA